MKAITLRNIPAEVARAIERRATEQRTSLNRVVIRLLEESLGIAKQKPKKRYHDLDWFFGSMTEEQAREMEESLRDQRKIDPEMWK